MCNNNDQTLFLAKITQVIKLLDEIDEMIENNPTGAQDKPKKAVQIADCGQL